MPISNKTVFSFMDEGSQNFENAIYSCDYETVIKMLQTNVAASYLDYEDAGIAILLIESGNPEFADNVITFVEENNLGYIWSQTRDGITPMQAARYTSPEMIKILIKHLYTKPRGYAIREKMGYDFRCENDREEADKYYVTRKMEELAFYYHYQSLRKDNITSEYEHPKAVVKMLEEFGVTDPVTLAIAWGHDLIEDEKIQDDIILKTSPEYGKAVLEGIKTLTFIPTDKKNKELKSKEKELYLKNIAENASPDLLLIKVADRLCNTLDFKKLSGKEKACDYLKKGTTILEQYLRLPVNFKKAILKKLKEVINIICQENDISTQTNNELLNYNPRFYTVSEILIKEFEKRFPEDAKSVFIPNVEIWHEHIKYFVMKYPKSKFTLAITQKSELNNLIKYLSDCHNIDIITTEKNALFSNPGKFDLILAVPYIGSLEFSIMSYKQNLIKPELRAISNFANCLNVGGHLIMIMPQCFIFGNDSKQTNLRNHLLNNYKITEINYLPSYVLNHTYIQTSLINLTTGNTDSIRIRRYKLAINTKEETDCSIERFKEKENWQIQL